MSDSEMFGDDWGSVAKEMAPKLFKTKKEQEDYEIGFVGGCFYTNQRVTSYIWKLATDKKTPPTEPKKE